MKRSKTAFVLFCTLVLAGCGVNFAEKKDNQSNKLLAIQSITTTPQDGSILISMSELQPGDILLSSSFGVNSLSIRVFSLSPVSHASIYIGNNQIAEAVGSGVQIITVEEAIADSRSLVAYRYPNLTPEQAMNVRAFALDKEGSKYNYKGIILMTPFMLTKKVCEVVFVFSDTLRNDCLNSFAQLHLGSGKKPSQRFFCSQFVVEAYNYAGHPITNSSPIWVAPGDLLHMREDDVNSITSYNSLSYIGHLRSRK